MQYLGVGWTIVANTFDVLQPVRGMVPKREDGMTSEMEMALESLKAMANRFKIITDEVRIRIDTLLLMISADILNSRTGQNLAVRSHRERITLLLKITIRRKAGRSEEGGSNRVKVEQKKRRNFVDIMHKLFDIADSMDVSTLSESSFSSTKKRRRKLKRPKVAPIGNLLESTFSYRNFKSHGHE